MSGATSWSGIRFIAQREAMVSVAYTDGAHADGSPKYSIGFGSQTGNPKPGDRINIGEALARLRADIAARDITIGKALTVPVTQSEWDALASLYYQAGTSAFSRVAFLFSHGTATYAIRDFINHNFGVDGVQSEGHTKRRIREMIMALDGYYGDLSQFPLYDGDPRKVARQMHEFPPE
jgi:GH24 family phage-related lysozyme (muramidase)